MRAILILLLIVSMTACSATDPYTLSINEKDRDTQTIPDGCKSFFEKNKMVVAVTAFTNNTSYQSGNVKSVSASSGVAVNSFSGRAFSSYNEISQYVNPQLSEFAQSAVESLMVSIGGTTVVSRDKLDAVLKEQQFQMTLADPDTVVDLGMMMGAQYIVTGSVDTINVKYTSAVNTNSSGNKSTFDLAITLGSLAYNAAMTGWNIDTVLTINLVDVSTGKVMATHKSKGSANIGDSRTFTVNQIVEGSKKAMDKGLKDSLSFFNNYFETKAYINELRGDKKLALISLGKDDGLRAGDKFELINLVSQKDFRTGAVTCNTVPANVKFVTTKYISENTAWVKVDAKNAQALAGVKVGSLVKRTSVSR